jgi:hypothetical protein
MSDTDIHIVKCNVLNAFQSQEVIALKERIKRLEEVAEDLVEESDIYDRRRIWRKAKEAKP